MCKKCVQNQLEAVNRGLYGRSVGIFYSLIINPEEAALLEKGGFKMGMIQDMKMTILLLKC